MTEQHKAWATGVQTYGPDRLQAKCSCGWTGPPRLDGDKAEDDARDHAIYGEHKS